MSKYSFPFLSFFFENRADSVYLHGTARQVTDGNLIRHMLFAWRKIKAMDVQSEYVLCITFPWQQWLCKTILRLYLHCLSRSVLLIVFPVKHKLLQVIWCMWHDSIIVSLHSLQVYCVLSVAKTTYLLILKVIHFFILNYVRLSYQ